MEITADLALQNTRNSIATFLNSHPEAETLDKQRADLLSRKLTITAKISQAMLDIERLEATLKQVSSGDFSSLLRDPAVVRVLNLKDQTLLKRETLKTRYGRSHSAMIGVEKELEKSEKLVAQQVKMAQERLKLELGNSRKTLSLNQQALSTLKDDELALARLEQEYLRLRDDMNTAKNSCDQIIRKKTGQNFANTIVTQNLIGSRSSEILGLVFITCSLIIMMVLYLGHWLRSNSSNQAPGNETTS